MPPPSSERRRAPWLAALLAGAGLLAAGRAVPARSPAAVPAAHATAPPERARGTLPRSEEQVVVLETVVGSLAIRLYPADAPRTVASFRKLVSQRFYDSLTFHRVAPGFVIQGGDPNSRNENPFDDGNGGPGFTLPPEIKRKHVKGAVAMARLPDEGNPT